MSQVEGRLLEQYNHNMSTSCRQQDSSLRKQKFLAIRDTLKMMPCIKKKSSQLQKKAERIKLSPSNTEDLSESSQRSCASSPKGKGNQSIQEDQFFQNYELLEKVGEGCNATVFKSIYKPTDKIYAVKKIKVEEEHILNIKKDFIYLKELNHPSICQYKALYIKHQQRVAYLVMEYLPFLTLDKYEFDCQQELRNIVRQLLQAIKFIHSRNICHRDIKPQNILYDKKTQKIKLIDFGISKKTFLRGQRRQMLTVIGTPYFMAPQIFLGGGYDERSDLWSLGVTIYKMIAGKTPFESEYRAESIKMIQKGQIQFDEQKWQSKSSSLKNFIASFLEKVDKRMTIRQAEKHLWMLESQKKGKVRRLSSFIPQINENYHEEMIRQTNASSKEEGSTTEERTLFKNINLLSNNTFDLLDSDNEQDIVPSPSDLKTRSCPADFKTMKTRPRRSTCMNKSFC